MCAYRVLTNLVCYRVSLKNVIEYLSFCLSYRVCFLQNLVEYLISTQSYRVSTHYGYRVWKFFEVTEFVLETKLSSICASNLSSILYNYMHTEFVFQVWLTEYVSHPWATEFGDNWGCRVWFTEYLGKCAYRVWNFFGIPSLITIWGKVAIISKFANYTLSFIE